MAYVAIVCLLTSGNFCTKYYIFVVLSPLCKNVLFFEKSEFLIQLPKYQLKSAFQASTQIDYQLKIALL